MPALQRLIKREPDVASGSGADVSDCNDDFPDLLLEVEDDVGPGLVLSDLSTVPDLEPDVKAGDDRDCGRTHLTECSPLGGLPRPRIHDPEGGHSGQTLRGSPDGAPSSAHWFSQ